MQERTLGIIYFPLSTVPDLGSCMILRMKKAAFFLCLSVLLSACGGSSSEAVACTSSFWNGDVGVCLPSGWYPLLPEELQESVPNEVILAFQSEELVAGKRPTVTVTKEVLEDASVTSEQYSDASLELVRSLPGYEEVRTRSQIIDNETVTLHTFTLQPLPDQPRQRFYQVSAVAEGVGYSLTAALPVSLSDDTPELEILAILGSLTFTEQEAE